MRAPLAGLILSAAIAAIAVPAPLGAQAPARPLQPIDMFRLEYFMLLPAEEPQGWLDATRYLVFDPGKPSPQGPNDWYSVDARTGAREKLVDRREVLAQLTELGIGKDGLAAIDDADSWIWSGDHSRYVLNLSGDLWGGAPGQKVVRLTETPDEEEDIVLFSPAGDRVSFVCEHNLYVVPASGGDAVAITAEGHADRFFGKLDWVYQEEVFGRGDFQATWWSPDGEHLAFLDLDESPVMEFTLVSDVPARPEVEVTNYPKAGEDNPKVWLCVAPAGGGEIRRFDVSKYPDDDRLIVRVNWAPDSEQVFFQVQDRAQTFLHMLSGDPATGAVSTVFEEGSDCWVEPGPEPQFFADGDSFLWLSERSGFKHLWRYDRAASGWQGKAMTDGEWQVLEVANLDEAGGLVWFLSDQASPLQTHLYRMPLDGGEIARITKGRGTWSVDMAPGCGLFLGEWSSAVEPPRTSLLDGAGAMVRAVTTPKSELMAPYQLVEPEFVQVPARDGFPMEAMIFKPKDLQDGVKDPVVQHTYSGPHAPRVRDEWGGRDYVWHQLLVQQGYVVFVCDNRSASGKGREYAKACWRDLGTSELNDLGDAVKWLAGQGYADPENIGLWGWSYGGYQTLFNMTHSRLWKCGVAVNPVTDWSLYDTIYTERYLGTPQDNQQGYARASVITSAGGLSGPLMLVAAAMDDNVHMQNSLQFLHALQMAGKDCDFMVYPRVRHGIGSLEQQIHLFTRMKRFFDNNLKGGE